MVVFGTFARSRKAALVLVHACEGVGSMESLVLWVLEWGGEVKIREF